MSTKFPITLIDFSTILYKSFHGAVSTAKQKEEIVSQIDIIENVFFSMNNIFSTYKNNYIVMDGKNGNTWRRDIFPDYKLKRARHSDVSILYNSIDEIVDILRLYPCKVIRIKDAEADDCIYVLAEKYADKDVLVLSTDKDLIQLMNYFPKTEVYDMYKKKYYEKDEQIVEKKIIVGDPSDNIFGISRIGIKTFEKMMNNEELYEEKIKENEYLIEMFRKIVDLRLIPDNIKQLILEQDEIEIFNKYDPQKIEWHFYMNKYKRLLDRWHNYESEIKKLL